MYASIFGNVSAIIQRLYSGTARYHVQFLRIKEFIRFFQIPNPLRQRLEEYFTQAWAYTNGIDMAMVQRSFPDCIQTDICSYVYRKFLAESPVFQGSSEGCVRNISMRLRSMHIPPGDTVIYPDGLLTALYFVSRGSLEVIDTDDGSVLGVLSSLDFIGGIPPLLLPPGTPAMVFGSMPPPAKSRFAVRALTFADIDYLERDDLAELMALYPELSNNLTENLEFTFPLADSVADWNEVYFCLSRKF
ncbi:Potassium voltage-gated channel subfamily H member 7 [Cichlidogyrus casuarinus]|uniref:Potassium voltage-gated channel subfamily H member 7 n=1 Tax=Cichlidogyrus casuarinus TaxID=1844966 RepID=A0ABD2Q175_9PLAT